MTETFEIFDVETANQIGTYATKEAALHVIPQALGILSTATVANLALGREGVTGDTEVIARGRDLLHLANVTNEAG